MAPLSAAVETFGGEDAGPLAAGAVPPPEQSARTRTGTASGAIGARIDRSPGGKSDDNTNVVSKRAGSMSRSHGHSRGFVASPKPAPGRSPSAPATRPPAAAVGSRAMDDDGRPQRCPDRTLLRGIRPARRPRHARLLRAERALPRPGVRGPRKT